MDISTLLQVAYRKWAIDQFLRRMIIIFINSHCTRLIHVMPKESNHDLFDMSNSLGDFEESLAYQEEKPGWLRGASWRSAGVVLD